MRRTMTMNGHQTQTTVPLDLRTTKRECGNGADWTPTSKGLSVRVRVPYPTAPLTEDDCPNGNPSPTVEPLAHRCGSSLIKPPVNTGNPAVLEKKHSPAVTSHTPFPPNPGERSTTDTRTQDISSSRLPFRKRQFPTEWETPEQSRTPPEREERLSPYKDLCYRPSPPNIFLQSYDNENIGSLASVSHRQLSVASGFDNGHQSVGPVRSMQAPRPYYPYPGYPFYSWPSRSPLVVNVPVSHLPSSLYPTGHTEHLLADVAQATCQDDDGDTAIHIAVVQGQDAQIQRMILLLGLVHTDLDIYNNLRQTPLHLAVITHQAQLVGALLRAGADPRALDRNGQTTVHLCCEHGQQACLSVVLSHPSILTCLEVRNYEGLTPLHLAVQGGHKELVRMLLDAGADINAVDIKSGHSPLIHAVENHNMDMVHFLIENDCNVNGQSYSGNTALHSACGRGQVDTARLLLKNRADSSVKNYHNDTPAMVAKNKKVTDVLRGKGSRNQQPKAQQCVPASPHRSTPQSQNRGSPSPSLSPLATPTASPLHHSASHSPRAPPTPSPHSQSAESLSGRQSPMKIQESEQLPVRLGSDRMTAVDNSLAQRRTYSLTHSYPPAMHHQPPITDAPIGHLLAYYSPGVQRPLYPEPPFILLHTNIPYPATVSTASQMTPGQSRPSSHCSDQSDVSITSVNMSKGNS
ncbi:B-cell lymphoma 3 protein homolog isoform X2 [Salvelinus fontinalis]|uniref:B-cell lymphoma 3 protein homolog isoform X2 n=1 Tax=Salvelinus fontinalis TaxID=8038 RepID=UPI0024858333|nr:B-cell lymphoma 3 protein homolog isoform X2 [Salvelinus fontinalis]